MRVKAYISAHMSENVKSERKGWSRMVARRTLGKTQTKKQAEGGKREGREDHGHTAPIYSHACTQEDQ